MRASATNYKLYRTADFVTFTFIANVLPDHGHTVQDHIVLGDGTFVIYETENEGEEDAGTAVWTGSDLEDMTRLGQVVPETDCGVFYDAANHTIHIYTEDADKQSGVCSYALSHWTTPDDDLLNATQQENAIDVEALGWKTGDPDIIEIDGTYYMFTDRTTGHPDYRIAIFSSPDLYTWTLVQEYLDTDIIGGDLVLCQNGALYEGMVEFSGVDLSGIGHLQVTKL